MTTVLPMGRGPPGGFRVVRAPGHERRGVNGMTVADEVSGEGRTGALVGNCASSAVFSW